MDRERDRDRDRVRSDRPDYRDRDRDRDVDRHNRDYKRDSHGNQRDRRNDRDREPKGEKYEYGKKEHQVKEEPVKEKEKPSLEPSGNLAKDTNTYNGVVIKYNEPPEARKPIKRWRLYCFKGDQELPFYPMHRQSAYLFGRDRLVADIPVEHPSCSKQHAVFQYRLIEYKRKDGNTGRTIKPYIIDLGSTNGTFVNNQQIEAQRYFELREKDVIKFGFSTREFVLLHEESKNDLPSDNDDYEEESTSKADSTSNKQETASAESTEKSKKKDDSSSHSSSSSSDSESDDEKNRKKSKK